MGFSSTFSMAVLPVAKVLLTCAFGAWLGSPKMNILTAEVRKNVNVLVFVAYTPALVFTKLARAISWGNIVAWWYMPINVLLSFAIGSGLGFIVVKYTNPPPHLKTLTIACCAAGNIGNIPLVLVPSICLEQGSPFGNRDTCSVNAVAYVSFGLWMGMTLTWTFIYNLLRPPDDSPKSMKAIEVGRSGAISPSSSEFGEFQSGPLHREHDYDHFFRFPEGEFSNRGFREHGSPSNPPNYEASHNMEMSFEVAPPTISDPKAFFFYIVEKYELKKVITPPTAAAVVGLMVGAISPLKWLLLGPLRVFTDSADIIGQAMIPSMNLVLGASLVQGAGESELQFSTIIGIILVRLLFLPIIGMILMKLTNDLGLLPPDPLFRFVLMIQYTMPTAINIGTVTQLHGVGEKEAALVLFWSYIIASVLITFWVLLYLTYIF